MKNKLKFLGIIAMVVVIGFSMASCASFAALGEAASGGGSNGGYTAAWPADDVWEGYGLSGLQPPPGKENFSAGTVMGMYTVGTPGDDRAAYDNLVAQIRGISGVTEAVAEKTDRDGRRIGFTTSTGNNVFVMLVTGRDGSVSVTVQR